MKWKTDNCEEGARFRDNAINGDTQCSAVREITHQKDSKSGAFVVPDSGMIRTLFVRSAKLPM